MIRGSNLPTDDKKLALRYICIFLEHVKVGAIRGNIFSTGRGNRGNHYL